MVFNKKDFQGRSKTNYEDSSKLLFWSIVIGELIVLIYGLTQIT